MTKVNGKTQNEVKGADTLKVADVNETKQQKLVILDIGGYEIETEIVQGTYATRKHDVAKALSWMVKQDEIVDGDSDFAEDVSEWVDGIARDLNAMETDGFNWNAWASSVKQNLAKTLERTISTAGERNVDETPYITIHFNDYEVATPIKLSENYKVDLVNAYSYIASNAEIIEGDESFADELRERIISYAREMELFHIQMVDDSIDWEAWCKKQLKNIKKSLAVYKVGSKKPVKSKTVSEAMERLEQFHNIKVDKNRVGRSFSYGVTINGELISNTSKELIDLEYKLTAEMFESVALGA